MTNKTLVRATRVRAQIDKISYWISDLEKFNVSSNYYNFEANPDHCVRMTLLSSDDLDKRVAGKVHANVNVFITLQISALKKEVGFLKKELSSL